MYTIIYLGSCALSQCLLQTGCIIVGFNSFNNFCVFLHRRRGGARAIGYGKHRSADRDPVTVSGFRCEFRRDLGRGRGRGIDDRRREIPGHDVRDGHVDESAQH